MNIPKMFMQKAQYGINRGDYRQKKLRPNEIVLIGDRNTDIEAGRSLGIVTYLV